MRRFTAVAVLVPLVAAAEPAVLSPPRTIAADEVHATAAGTTFVAPAGWTLSSSASLAVLQPPEADSRVAIVDVRASGAVAAVASAWSALRVGAIRPIRVSTPIGVSDGWEEGWRVEYEVSPNERAFAEISNARKRLAVPPDPAAVDRLGDRYRSAALGEIVVRRRAGETVFDFGEWGSPVASRKNDDGTVSFVTIDPSDYRLELVASERGGRRALVLRDAQHEYVFLEVPRRRRAQRPG